MPASSALAMLSPPAKARRSIPAQNARSPVPVSTTARTSGSASASTRAGAQRAGERRGQRVAGLGPVEAQHRHGVAPLDCQADVVVPVGGGHER